MWQFIISTGELLHNWQHCGYGYSGAPEARNNPDLTAVPNVGPIPCGTYRIGKPYDHPKLGPHVMNLDPIDGTNTFGRSEFRIHGDSIANPGTASHGCVILNRIVRNQISASSDDLLRVIARGPDEMQSMSVPS
jgi:hypothetical protein